MRSRSPETRIAEIVSRRSIAIGWRLAMSRTERSSISRWSVSRRLSARITAWASWVSRRTSASVASVIIFSATPPISEMERRRSSRSVS